MRYLEALLAVVIFVAAASLAFPRIAPLAARVGLIAAIIIAALCAGRYPFRALPSSPPPMSFSENRLQCRLKTLDGEK